MIEIQGVPSARDADVREVNGVVTSNVHTESLGGITYPATIAEVEDIANAILFLASDESKMITGTEIVIDGGLSAQ